MVTIFIIPKSNIRFIGIYFLTTSPVTAIDVTLISRIHIEYLSHAFRYCSIFLNTNISPLIPSPRKIRIAIILKNHDHSVEKNSRHLKYLILMDGSPTPHTCTQTSMEQLCKQINLFEILYFLLLPIKPRSCTLSSRIFPFLSLHFSTFLFHNLFFLHSFYFFLYLIKLVFYCSSFFLCFFLSLLCFIYRFNR